MLVLLMVLLTLWNASACSNILKEEELKIDVELVYKTFILRGLRYLQII